MPTTSDDVARPATDTPADTADTADPARLAAELVAEMPPTPETLTDFYGAAYDRGLAWVHFPAGRGGLGISPAYQQVVEETFAAAGAPSAFLRNTIGYGMAAPTLVTHASPELADRLLRPLYTGEEIWCQLFSEPGAGSDVAGLSTRAERDGDGWIVNGQKVWTSAAHLARWGLLVARTDPDVPKHRGLTYFVLDMHDPGVEVRPLRQMTGDAEFNEVYLTDVRIPDTRRLGDVGAGWTVALTTLMNERTALGGGSGSPRNAGAIGWALRLWREHPERRTPVLRDRLAGLWAEAEANRLTGTRSRRARATGTPGPEGSVGKLVGAELNQRVYDFCVAFLGAEGILYGSYEMSRGRREQTDVRRAALRSRANTIEGGTSEIMRNILGERVLGLPGDVRTDSRLPWKDVPRG